MSPIPVPVTYAHGYQAAEAMDGKSLRDLESEAGLEAGALGRLATATLDPVGDELSAALPNVHEAGAKAIGRAVANAFAIGVVLGINTARVADTEAMDR